MLMEVNLFVILVGPTAIRANDMNDVLETILKPMVQKTFFVTDGGGIGFLYSMLTLRKNSSIHLLLPCGSGHPVLHGLTSDYCAVTIHRPLANVSLHQ